MPKESQTQAMVVLGVLFFLFGFVTWLNGSLIPFLKIICELNEFEALFVSFAFYIAYTVMALPMAFVLERTGYKKGMELGLGVMAFASLLFIPAALTAAFWLFLVALFMLATGLTILQSASNPYVVLLGPQESAARRISIMGLINKTAGVLAPILFTAFIFSQTNEPHISNAALAKTLITPYLLMFGVLLFLLLLLRLSSLKEPHDASTETKRGEKISLFAFPHLILGALALFFYVGAEVIAADTIGLYAQSLGVINATAFTAFTMAFMVFGYLLGIFLIPKFISQEKALLYSALFGVFATLGIALSSETSSSISELVWGWSGIATIYDTLFFVALLGLANALVWPTIWPLALDGVGAATPRASALLIMAIAGGALLPLVFGKMVTSGVSMQQSYLLLLVCYGVLFFYAKFWHKKRVWRRELHGNS